MLQKLAHLHDMLIVTSKRSPLARYNLESFRIDHYFRHIIGSDNVEHYKPHPDPVYKARATLAGRPAVEWVIGDADTDIMMGKSAGVKTCAVTWGAHPRARLEAAKPDYIVDSFEELSEIVLRAA
jgi:phosphoglycolate phosphatase-like HAD superfamily hydrolase